VDRGFLVFLIVAGLSLGTVWAILTRPRDTSSLSRIEELTTRSTLLPLPANASLPSISEERLLPSSQDLPDTAKLTTPSLPTSDLLLSVNPTSVPAVTPFFPRNPRFSQTNAQPVSQGFCDKDISDGHPVAGTPRQPPVDLPPSKSKPASQSLRHVVADGETLPLIAQHYYRDITLWTLIYQANQDRLSSPELLPVGTELVIPPVPRETESPGK